MGAASGCASDKHHIKYHISCTGTSGICMLQAAATGGQQLKVVFAETCERQSNCRVITHSCVYLLGVRERGIAQFQIGLSKRWWPCSVEVSSLLVICVLLPSTYTGSCWTCVRQMICFVDLLLNSRKTHSL